MKAQHISYSHKKKSNKDYEKNNKKNNQMIDINNIQKINTDKRA